MSKLNKGKSLRVDATSATATAAAAAAVGPGRPAAAAAGGLHHHRVAPACTVGGATRRGRRDGTNHRLRAQRIPYTPVNQTVSWAARSIV